MSRLKRSKAIKDFTKNPTIKSPEVKVSNSPFCLFSEKIPSPFVEVHNIEQEKQVTKPKFSKKTVIMEIDDEENCSHSNVNESDIFHFEF